MPFVKSLGSFTNIFVSLWLRAQNIDLVFFFLRKHLDLRHEFGLREWIRLEAVLEVVFGFEYMSPK